MNDDPQDRYRVTIRWFSETQRYEVFELEADDLKDALARTVERFPEDLVATADLLEVRRSNPAG
jgi:hypothetical protein